MRNKGCGREYLMRLREFRIVLSRVKDLMERKEGYFRIIMIAVRVYCSPAISQIVVASTSVKNRMHLVE